MKNVFIVFLCIFLLSCSDNHERTIKVIDDYKLTHKCSPVYFEEKIKSIDICGRYNCSTSPYKYTIVTYRCNNGHQFTEELTDQ